jgi:hypothetical protein
VNKQKITVQAHDNKLITVKLLQKSCNSLYASTTYEYDNSDTYSLGSIQLPMFKQISGIKQCILGHLVTGNTTSDTKMTVGCTTFHTAINDHEKWNIKLRLLCFHAY